MSLITPYLLLVLAAFAAFMIVLLTVSLRCWGMAVPRASASETTSPSEKPPAPLREAA
jgi:hypothetical protein